MRGRRRRVDDDCDGATDECGHAFAVCVSIESRQRCCRPVTACGRCQDDEDCISTRLGPICCVR